MAACHIRDRAFEFSAPFTTDRLTRTDEQVDGEGNHG